MANFSLFLPGASRSVACDRFILKYRDEKSGRSRYYCGGLSRFNRIVLSNFYNFVQVRIIKIIISPGIGELISEFNSTKIRQKMRSMIAGFKPRPYQRHNDKHRVYPSTDTITMDAFKLPNVHDVTWIFSLRNRFFFF